VFEIFISLQACILLIIDCYTLSKIPGIFWIVLKESTVLAINLCDIMFMFTRHMLSLDEEPLIKNYEKDNHRILLFFFNFEVP